MGTTDLTKPSSGHPQPGPDPQSGAAYPQATPRQFPSPVTAAAPFRLDVAALSLAVLALFAALKLHLLSALLSGLLIYELVHVLAPKSKAARATRRTQKVIALTVLASIIILAVFFAILGVMSLLARGPESLPILLQTMADVIEAARTRLPVSAGNYLPEDVDELKDMATEWLREHAGQLRVFGQDVWRALVHILVGMVIGGMIAVSSETHPQDRRPLAQALTDRARLLGSTFRRVVFAQVRISAINAVLTGVYLLVILPLLDIRVPFAETMIAVTFLVGLLPVIGNLISNTIIVVVSLSVSLFTAISSLIFLVLIHKLEYFINARIIGGQFHLRPWGAAVLGRD